MTLPWWQPTVLIAALIAVMSASTIYLSRVRMPRPPIGRFTASDVAFMTVMLLVMPFAYVHLPIPAVSAAFGLLFVVAGQTALAPAIGGRLSTAVVLILAGGELAAAFAGPAPMAILNDILIGLALVGVTNLWVQTGATCGHVAALAAVLAGYDLVATGLSSLTAQFIAHTLGQPFAPLFAVVHGNLPISLGLGDCLMLTLWPLALAKGYGRKAAWTGGALGVLVVTGVEVGFAAQWISPNRVVPLLTILGPIMIIHYLLLRHRHGPDRRTWRWRNLPAPTPVDPAQTSSQVHHALATAATLTELPPETWVALHQGVLIGHGQTPGIAMRCARAAGCTTIPTVIQLPRG